MGMVLALGERPQQPQLHLRTIILARAITALDIRQSRHGSIAEEAMTKPCAHVRARSTPHDLVPLES